MYLGCVSQIRRLPQLSVVYFINQDSKTPHIGRPTEHIKSRKSEKHTSVLVHPHCTTSPFVCLVWSSLDNLWRVVLGRVGRLGGRAVSEGM